RCYLPTPVPRSTVEDIIDVARHSPCSSNLQPWTKVYCLSGDALASVSNDMLDAYLRDPTGHRAEYDYFPAEMPTPYTLRRQEFGRLYYGAYNVEQHDVEGRRRVMDNNYKFYGAPVGLIFTVDRRLRQSTTPTDAEGVCVTELLPCRFVVKLGILSSERLHRRSRSRPRNRFLGKIRL
ncbi:hypothetical protein CPB85DRAFT_1226192, partial [Mucidula mucida]